MKGSLSVTGETPGKETSGYGRLIGRSFSSGRNINKERKATHQDISSHFSGNSTVSRRALGIF